MRKISLHVNAGESVALIGANGAGKTTTLKALARLHTLAGGSVRYCGKEISRLLPHQIVTEGIALVPEGRGVFPRMNVIDNLRMGAYCRQDTATIAEDMARIFSYFPRLGQRTAQLAGSMSGGEQQMLAIGRALMSRPTLLLLDEPSMGLAPLMVGKIFEVIQEVAEQGLTVLLVEQNAKLALEMSHRGYVMESGEITIHDDAKTLLADLRVRAAYLGS